MRSTVVSTCLAIAAAACGGSYPKTATPEPATRAAADDGPRGVEAAALPFEILDRDGHQLAADSFYAALAGARAVCLGEQHPNPHDHWAQLHLVDQISQRAGAAGRPFALGMEMFQRPYQGVLDDYAAGTIDAAALLSRSGWGERWGFDFGLYQPIIDLARTRKGALVALNISTELRKKIKADGIDGLAPDDRARVPELDLDNQRHRAWWKAIMESMGGAHGHASGHGEGDEDGPPMSEEDKKALAEKIYLAQVLWDETMADTASRWLAAQPDSLILILAGNGHCHDSAIVDRVKRRGHDRALSVRPVIDTGEGEVADALAERETDYLFVMRMPETAKKAKVHEHAKR